MVELALFLFCTGWSAWRIAGRLAAREPDSLTPLERLIWTAVLGLALWLAQGWLLALAGRFQVRWLLVSAVALLVLVLIAVRHVRVPASSALRFNLQHVRRYATPARGLPLLLVGTWVAYSAAALSVTPVSNHDALAYHFPKAARLALGGTFALYPSQDLRVTYYPGNYETLLATFLAFLRSDTSTGLITSGLFLLFVVTGFALFKRVWTAATPASLAMAVLLGSPVLLLHATAHKNDLLLAATTLNALMWLGRFAVHGGAGSAVIGLVCVALSVGTKFHGLFLVLASTVPLWRAWRNRVWRPTALQAIRQFTGVALAFLLLGGFQYVANALQTGHLTGVEPVPTVNAVNTVAYPAFQQVPRFVWMFLAAPVLTSGKFFLVPWSGETWFWPAYELYFSHYGVHVSLLILLLPLGIRWTRRTLPRSASAELSAISLPALLLVGMTALIGLRPYGGFAFIPRFLLFALPILLAWTWCPWVVHFGRLRPSSWLPLVAAMAIPAAYGVVTTTNDGFTPLVYVKHLWIHPEDRRVVYQASWRAASAFDRVAPAQASVAVDAGYDGWTYPLYGAALSRSVEFIVNAPEDYLPGPQIDWVVVDHAFSTVWGHPGFQSMALADQYLDSGTPTERERRVFKSVSKNPAFKLAYFRPDRFQAVFQRIQPADH